ncbi:hypothetical protein HYY69_03895 [Candidatus Woesearchaeota archaeon]|nr:hypothetical protein [Candidatus Woesearchaeota archaeon]
MDTKKFATIDEVLGYNFPSEHEREGSVLRELLDKALELGVVSKTNITTNLLKVEYPIDPDQNQYRTFTRGQVLYADQLYGMFELDELPLHPDLGLIVLREHLSDTDTETVPALLVKRLLARRSFDDPQKYVDGLVQALTDPAVLKTPRTERVIKTLQDTFDRIWNDIAQNQRIGDTSFTIVIPCRGYLFPVMVVYDGQRDDLKGGCQLKFSLAPGEDSIRVAHAPRGLARTSDEYVALAKAFYREQAQRHPFFPKPGSVILSAYCLPEHFSLRRIVRHGKAGYFNNAQLYHRRIAFSFSRPKPTLTCMVYIDARYLRPDQVLVPDDNVRKNPQIKDVYDALAGQRTHLYTLSDYVAHVYPKVKAPFLIAPLTTSLLGSAERKLYREVF